MWNQTITHHRQTARTDHPSPPPPPPSTAGGRLKGGLHPLRTPQQHISRSFPPPPGNPPTPRTDRRRRTGRFYTVKHHIAASVSQYAAFLARPRHRGRGGQKEDEINRGHRVVHGNKIRTAKRAAPSRRTLVTWKTVGRWSNLYRDNVLSTEERKVENPFIYFVLPIKRALRHTVSTDR